MNLAQIDDAFEFRQLLDEANRANAAFYPFDPRGLPVFDSPISAPLPLKADLDALRTRVETLRTLAENTDGLAIVNSNDLAGGFKRIVNDLSSYYLMGFYSSGKLDGKFHSITVRVKRPGVQVRARRGYLARHLGRHRGRGHPRRGGDACEGERRDGCGGVSCRAARRLHARRAVALTGRRWMADGRDADRRALVEVSWAATRRCSRGGGLAQMPPS